MAKENTTPEEVQTEEGQEPKTEETKTEEKKKSKKAEPKTVEVFIPRGSNANDDPNMFVSVNGVNYLLPRGKKSKVPAEVAEEINRSLEAQAILDQHVDEMLAASK